MLALDGVTHPPPRLWRLLLWLWVSHCFVVKTQVEFGPKVHLSVAVWIQFHCGTGGVLGTTDAQSELVSCHLFSSVCL